MLSPIFVFGRVTMAAAHSASRVAEEPGMKGQSNRSFDQSLARRGEHLGQGDGPAVLSQRPRFIRTRELPRREKGTRLSNILRFLNSPSQKCAGLLSLQYGGRGFAGTPSVQYTNWQSHSHSQATRSQDARHLSEHREEDALAHISVDGRFHRTCRLVHSHVRRVHSVVRSFHPLTRWRDSGRIHQRTAVRSSTIVAVVWRRLVA